MNIIYNGLNQMLYFLFNSTGDWGISIILLTIVVKLILMPMSIKQKISIEDQQDISKKLDEIKEKYKNNESKLEEETQKFYAESAKGMFGCLVTLLQIPIIIVLYQVITKIPYEARTILIPWISSIKTPDKFFIIPITYALVSCIPTLIPYIPYFKAAYRVKTVKTNIITTIIISLAIIIKAPIGIGMYFITTSLFSTFEELSFRFYLKNKKTQIST